MEEWRMIDICQAYEVSPMSDARKIDTQRAFAAGEGLVQGIEYRLALFASKTGGSEHG